MKHIIDEDLASKVENAVCAVFGYRVPELVCFTDTVGKKIVVYLFRTFFDFEARVIGRRYQISYPFVPTVVEQIEVKIILEQDFKNKLIQVCDALGISPETIQNKYPSLTFPLNVRQHCL